MKIVLMLPPEERHSSPASGVLRDYYIGICPNCKQDVEFETEIPRYASNIFCHWCGEKIPMEFIIENGN